jgi:hypothetical protein
VATTATVVSAVVMVASEAALVVFTEVAGVAGDKLDARLQQ